MLYLSIIEKESDMKKYLLKRDINKVKYLFLGVMILIMIFGIISGLIFNYLSTIGNANYGTGIIELFFMMMVYIIGFVVLVICSLFIPYVFIVLYQNDKKEASIIMINHDNYRFLIYQRTFMVASWLILSLLLGFLVFDLINFQMWNEGLLDVPISIYNLVINIGLGIVFLSLIIVNNILTKSKKIIITSMSILLGLLIIVFNFVMIPVGWNVPFGEQIYLYGNIVYLISAFVSYFIAVELLLLNINKRLDL